MIFDYLYFKIYQAVLRSSLKDVAAYIVPLYMGGLLAVNILVLSAFLSKNDIAPFLFKSKVIAGIFVVVIMASLLLIYNTSRRDLIVKRFENEGKANKVRGNAIVICYVFLSFFSIFFIAFFKPGKI